MKTWLRCVTGALPLLVVGCSAPAPVPTKPAPTAYLPQFKFTPPSVAEPGSAKVTIALVTYRDNKEAWNTFYSRFSTDLQNILVARGYSVKGPFSTKDEMTYSDKKESDFILTYSISANLDFFNVAILGQPSSKLSLLPEAEKNILWDGTWSELPLLGKIKNLRGSAAYFNGEFTSNTKINLLLSESQTGEKLWSKTIDVPISPEPFESNQMHALPNGLSPDAAIKKTTFFDQSMLNAYNKSLDKIYNHSFTTIWKHVDPSEMKIIKHQADEIKSKKVF